MNSIQIEETKHKLSIKIKHSENWLTIFPIVLVALILTIAIGICLVLAISNYKELFAISFILLLINVYIIMKLKWLMKGESELKINSKTLYYSKKHKLFETKKELQKSDLISTKVYISHPLSPIRHAPMGNLYLRIFEKINPFKYQINIETHLNNKVILERLSKEDSEILHSKIINHLPK